MAKALKCDICGKLYEHYEGFPYDEHGNKYNQIRLSNDSANQYGRVFDTCSCCMHFVIDLMKSMKEENSNGES